MECGIASEIILYGGLEYSPGSPWDGTHSVDTPALNVLFAYVALVLGTTPIVCAQIVTAVLSVLTVGAVFLLGRVFSGTVTGGVIASTVALLSGTFVFTTGSAWKMSLGFALIAFLYFAFINRNHLHYRLLTFGILCLLPFTHHLAAVAVLVSFAFMMIWSWIVALSQRNVTKRLWWDTLTVGVPGITASLYYSVALIDRQDIYESEFRIITFICIFLLLSTTAYLAMRMRKHQKVSFAPIIGIALAVILLFDYFGLVFHYRASAPAIYISLIISMAVLVTVAWYGTEVIVEHRRRFMALHLSIIVAPLTIMLFGVSTGSAVIGLQTVYRTFDFLQFFIFIGIAVAITDFRAKRPKPSRLIVVLVSICLVTVFPFGFFTAELLGVRHDSQAYEIDSMHWLSEHSDNPSLVSDERLSFMARSTMWIEKSSHLPNDMIFGGALLPQFYYMAEDNWIVTGVNVFPSGLVFIDEQTMELALDRSNVVYMGGPADDRLYIFTSNRYISLAN